MPNGHSLAMKDARVFCSRLQHLSASSRQQVSVPQTRQRDPTASPFQLQPLLEYGSFEQDSEISAQKLGFWHTLNGSSCLPCNINELPECDPASVQSIRDSALFGGEVCGLFLGASNPRVVYEREHENIRISAGRE